jgi:hypothetical protein
MILIIIILILIILVFKLNINIENYDGRVSEINKIENCANICSSIYNVSAFAYDVNGNCYISKTSLSRPPIQLHPYHKNFKPTDIICNKVNFIRSKKDLNDKNNVISNRLYNCYINDSVLKDENSELYYFEKDKKALKINREDITKLPYDKEKMFKIDWPKNRKELSDIDISYDNTTIKDIYWEPAIESKVIKNDPYRVYENNYDFKNTYQTCILHP